MLAVAAPFSATTPPDVAPRRSITTRSTNLASQPPLHRHHTAPAVVVVAPPRPPTPTPKIASPPPVADDPQTPFDINAYPAADLLRLLALLLTHIATTNDSLSMSQPNITIDPLDMPPIWNTLTTASRSAISTPAATLTFHARNVPTISLEAYLLRILKYCPTSNHVFLSLLVYFDRISKLSEEAVGRAFVIDSYNIHRLVIAGVTVASKFFSDVFYTNSRYAKVGGLPLSELNQLELQFLLLNDFRLVITSDEMQHYAEQLILFARSTAVGEGVVHAPPLAANMKEESGVAHEHQHQHQHPPHQHHRPPVTSSTPSLSSHSSSSGSSTATVTAPQTPASVTPPVHPETSASTFAAAAAAAASASNHRPGHSSNTPTSTPIATQPHASSSQSTPPTSSTSLSFPTIFTSPSAITGSSSYPTLANSYSRPLIPLVPPAAVHPVHSPQAHMSRTQVPLGTTFGVGYATGQPLPVGYGIGAGYTPQEYLSANGYGYGYPGYGGEMGYAGPVPAAPSRAFSFGAPGSGTGRTLSTASSSSSVASASTSTSSIASTPGDDDPSDADDASTDAGTETDMDASTDAGTASTDDEPTIRAGRTVAGSVLGDEGGEDERTTAAPVGRERERERRRSGSGSAGADDVRMRSP